MQFYNEADESTNLQRIEALLERSMQEYVMECVPLEATVGVGDERAPFARRGEAPRSPVAEGEVWAGEWQTGWFHLRGRVPETWAGGWVVAWLEIGGEGLVYDASGRALAGITNGSVFAPAASRSHLDLFPCAKGGEDVELWLEGAACPYFGPPVPGCCGREVTKRSTDPARFGRFAPQVQRLRLARVNRTQHAWRWDFEVAFSLVKSLPRACVRRARLIAALSASCDALGRKAGDFAGARACLVPELARRANASSIPVRAVGHAHIDTGWLWPLAETKRKVARTFANQLDLLEKYPGYIFGASAAQHYAWLKVTHPDLYARVKQAVAEGRWEIQGGMWVESDCNLPDGESLVRQFLHGKNFFREEFGVEVDNLWIPDVFGYPASLPQIMALAGCPNFLTQKISWSVYNEFPFNTFWWQGIDGTRVLTHFPPENNYNGPLDPASLIGAEERFAEKAFAPALMSLFGIGDGGGGPREDHLERGLRLRDLEGCPPVSFGTARDFFRELNSVGDRLRTWVGELYLEAHRGTLTTQAQIKHANRQLEQRLAALEKFLSLSPAAWPAARLDAIWKEVLTLQFHDILPGSSVNVVNRETRDAHSRLLEECDALQEEAAAALPVAEGLTLLNTLSDSWHGVVVLPASFAGRSALADGVPIPCQTEMDGTTVALVTLAGHAACTLTPGETTAPAVRPGDGRTLDNGLARFVFDGQGRLTEATVAGRNLLCAPGNMLSLYHDRPNTWDAWDVDEFYRGEKITEAAFDVEDLGAGPVRSRLRLRARVAGSEIEQIVSLAEGSRRLDFETHVDWREEHRMLRVAFPADVHTDRVACEIQYGHYFRPTHANTSWDMAKFEVAAHRWADLSEPTAGLALLNDGKFGHNLQNNTLDLNLLRAPLHPDPDADHGEHYFTYSLLPHAGDLLASDVLVEARRLNRAPLALPGRCLPGPLPAMLDPGSGVELTVIKRAERSGDLVLRLVETLGRRAEATLRLPSPAPLVPTDLLEWQDGEAGAPGCSHLLAFTPFQIRTFKIPIA
jgi:alpha-mannosidase